MIPEELIESLKEFCKEERSPNINFREFCEIEPREPVYAVDSGSNEVLSIGSASLYYIKVGYVGFERERRFKTEIKSLFLLMSPKGIKSFGDLMDEDEIEFFSIRMRELLEEMDYETVEKTILSGILRLLELKTGKELNGIVLFDFPFDFRFEILKEVFSKIKNKEIAGIVKRSRLLGSTFGFKNTFLVDALYRIKPKGKWFVKIKEDQMSCDYIVKFLESERAYPFRVSIKKDCDASEIFGKISFYADISKRGYPFPLSRIDKLVRVEEKEIDRIRRIIISLAPEIERFLSPEVKF